MDALASARAAYEDAFAQYCECVTRAGGRIVDVEVRPTGERTWGVEVPLEAQAEIEACKARFLVHELAFVRLMERGPSEEAEQLEHFRRWIAPALRDAGVAFAMPTSMRDAEWLSAMEAYLRLDNRANDGAQPERPEQRGVGPAEPGRPGRG